MGFDDSLVQALPGMCEKMPSERGSFDVMVLNQLETSLAAKSAELTKDLRAAKTGAIESATAVDTAKEQLEVAKTEQASTGVQAATAALATNEPEERRLRVAR